MKKSVIILAISFILILGIVAGIYADKIKDSSSDSSSDSDSSTSDTSSKDSKKDSSKEDKKDSTTDSKESKSEEIKSDKKDSKTDSKETSKQVKKTEEAYTFVGENQERLEIQIRTETKTKDGETYQKIKVRGVEAVSDLEIEKENGEKIKAKLSNGLSKEIKIMPNTASKIALSKLRSQNRTLELKEAGEGNNLSVVYVSEANKTTKFLGLFKVRYRLTAMINSETGEVMSLEGNPWWLFLSEQPLEEEELQNLSLQLIKPLDDINILKNNEITLDLNNYFFNAKEYSVSESENLSLILEDSLLTIIPKTNWTGNTLFSLTAINGNESLENLVNVFVTEENLSIQTTQYSAVVGEKVKWKKEFKSNQKEKLKLKLPENSENIILFKLNEDKEIINEEIFDSSDLDIQAEENVYYELEYFTPEPEIYEEEISQRNKKIIVKGIEDAHYTDVVAFEYLETQVEKEDVKLYHLGKNNKKEVVIDKYDLDKNGLIDYIEWVVPQLSNESYELVIGITKADHLDEDRFFLSDIYEQVRALDEIWSELIPNNHYVRVSFERELTSNKDITVFARSDTESSIEVYLKDSDEKIAEINGIQQEGEYKTYLDGLIGSSADFDLRIVSDSGVEFDYIVDPATLLIIYPQNTIYNSVVTELNYTVINAQECKYSLDGGATNVTITCGDNVTGLAANEGSNTWTVYANSTDTNLWDVSDSVTFSIDTTFPEISFVYPLNTSYSSDVASINYTYSESNCDSVWYSTDNGATNSTPVGCGTNFTSVTSNEGSNTWTIYINDTAGNENSSSVTFFKDTVYPQISFGTETSDNNSNLSQSNIYVNVSVTETNEDTIIFLLHNSTGEVNSSSYTDGTRNINWTGLADEIYMYNVTINDTLGNSNTTETRTVTLDTTAPVISFSCDKSSVIAGEILSCSCSAIDNLDSNPVVSYTANPSTSNLGTFTTSCSATDYAENSASSNIGYSVRSSGGGSPNYRVSSGDLGKGYTKIMRKNWKMNFKINNEKHTFKVEDINETSSTISVSSDTKEVTLKEGEEIKFELTNDSYYDLLVRLNSIDYRDNIYTNANFTIKSIDEEIILEEKEEFQPLGEDEEERKSFVWLWIIFGIFIIGIVVKIKYKKIRKAIKIYLKKKFYHKH